MKVKGSYSPPPFELEVMGENALIRLYENVRPDEDGYLFDRYTVVRPYQDSLRKDLEANTEKWIAFVRQEEHERLAAEMRGKRNRLLDATDWTQIPDADLSAEDIEAMRVYRQELRDFTESVDFPYTEIWPELPETTKRTYFKGGLS